MDPEVQSLRARVNELEQRLAEVEQRLSIRQPTARAEAPPTPPVPLMMDLSPSLPPPPPPPLPQPPPPVVVDARAADTVETKAGLVWVNRVGAVTVILSVAFGFKYAVDNEWIGPSGRVVLGLLAGGAALLGGDKLWQRGHRSFAQGITALGVCIFYLSFYAAYRLYGLIPQGVAFLGAIVTTAAGGALALRYDARTIATLALFGGYLSPFLASTGEPNDRFFGSYLFVLNAIALTLARSKRWLQVEIAAAAATLVLFTAWIATAGHRLTPVEGSLFVTLQFAVFALSPFFGIRALAPIAAMAGVAFLCGQYSSPAYWTWAALITLIGLAIAWRDRDDRFLGPSLAGWAFGFYLWDPVYAPHWSLFAGLASGFLTYLAAGVFLPAARRTLSTYSALAGNAIFFYLACYSWFDHDHHGYMGLLALAVAGSYLMAALLLRRQPGAPPEMPLVSAGLALSFITLAIPVQLSGYSITLAWGVESAVLAFLAVRLHSGWAFIGSWLIGTFALLLLFSQDAGRAWGADYSPVLNARFVPFLVMAGSLAANAYWTSHFESAETPRDLALAPFLAAHFTLLAGLHMEIFAWIQSGHEPGSELTSLLTLASSLLLAVYGLALLSHGVSREFRLHRLLGLALFAIVVVKLYLFDIWQLGRLYRILAFVAIGGLLLSGSYLYSRYRHRLLALLQDETRPA